MPAAVRRRFRRERDFAGVGSHAHRVERGGRNSSMRTAAPA